MSVCHCCFGMGYIPGEGYADCPYCDGTGFEDDEPEEYYNEEEQEEQP